VARGGACGRHPSAHRHRAGADTTHARAYSGIEPAAATDSPANVSATWHWIVRRGRSLRFSAECDSSGSVRHRSPESPPPWSAGVQAHWSFRLIRVRAARCRSVGQNAGRIAAAGSWDGAVLAGGPRTAREPRAEVVENHGSPIGQSGSVMTPRLMSNAAVLMDRLLDGEEPSSPTPDSS
jgi:hypothetical protein